MGPVRKISHWLYSDFNTVINRQIISRSHLTNTHRTYPPCLLCGLHYNSQYTSRMDCITHINLNSNNSSYWYFQFVNAISIASLCALIWLLLILFDSISADYLTPLLCDLSLFVHLFITPITCLFYIVGGIFVSLLSSPLPQWPTSFSSFVESPLFF